MSRAPRTKQQAQANTKADASSNKKMTAVVKIDGEMTVYRAAELKTLLTKALARKGEIEIDLAKVSELDTAGVQLLLLAKQEAQASGKALRLTQHSAAVVEVFETLNLASYFGDPIVLVDKHVRGQTL